MRVLALSFILMSFQVAAEPQSGVKAWNSVLLDDRTSWTDETGAKVQLKDFASRPVILTSFYTHCKRTCPEMTFRSLSKIQNKFEENKIEAEFLLVTLEPEEDTVDALAKFKKRVAPGKTHWHFLRADSDAHVQSFVKNASLGDVWKMEEHTLHEFKVVYFDQSKGAVKSLDFKHRDIASLFEP